MEWRFLAENKAGPARKSKDYRLFSETGDPIRTAIGEITVRIYRQGGRGSEHQ